jgi:hypothetical protein
MISIGQNWRSSVRYVRAAAESGVCAFFGSSTIEDILPAAKENLSGATHSLIAGPGNPGIFWITSNSLS